MDHYYDSDEEICWGPISRKEVEFFFEKRPAKILPRRHSDLGYYPPSRTTVDKGMSEPESEGRRDNSGTSDYFTPNESLQQDPAFNKNEVFLEKLAKVVESKSHEEINTQSTLHAVESVNHQDNSIDDSILNIIRTQDISNANIDEVHQTLVNNSLTAPSIFDSTDTSTTSTQYSSSSTSGSSTTPPSSLTLSTSTVPPSSSLSPSTTSSEELKRSKMALPKIPIMDLTNIKDDESYNEVIEVSSDESLVEIVENSLKNVKGEKRSTTPDNQGRKRKSLRVMSKFDSDSDSDTAIPYAVFFEKKFGKPLAQYRAEQAAAEAKARGEIMAPEDTDSSEDEDLSCDDEDLSCDDEDLSCDDEEMPHENNEEQGTSITEGELCVNNKKNEKSVGDENGILMADNDENENSVFEVKEFSEDKLSENNEETQNSVVKEIPPINLELSEDEDLSLHNKETENLAVEEILHENVDEQGILMTEEESSASNKEMKNSIVDENGILMVDNGEHENSIILENLQDNSTRSLNEGSVSLVFNDTLEEMEMALRQGLDYVMPNDMSSSDEIEAVTSTNNGTEGAMSTNNGVEDSMSTNNEIEGAMSTNNGIEDAMSTNNGIEDSMSTNNEIEGSMSTNNGTEDAMSTNNGIEDAMNENQAPMIQLPKSETKKRPQKKFDYIQSPIGDYIRNKSPSALNFKLPLSKPPKLVTPCRPSPVIQKKQLQGIVSPVGVYIKSGSAVCLKQNVPVMTVPKLGNPQTTTEIAKVSQQTVDCGIPQIIYQPPKKTIADTKKEINLPSSIKKLVKESYIEKHEKRVCKDSKQISVSRKLLEEDLTTTTVDSSLLNQTNEDVSFVTKKQAFIE